MTGQAAERGRGGPTFGGYRAVRLLATGGSSRVYLARDPNGHRVVLKVLDGPYQAALAAAKRQVALTTRVNHQHLVPVHGPVYDDADGGRVGVISEIAEGGTLAALLDRRAPLRPAELVTLLIPLAAALATAHEREVVHGDLTPANVLFDGAGRPLLTDLGAAQIVVDCGLDVAATPAFVAPEVARRARPTAASDVFALGAVALFAATGSPAWNADDLADVVVQSTVGQWPALPDELRPQFPAPLWTLVRSMLAELPADRPGAATVAVELARCGPPAPIDLAAAGRRSGVRHGTADDGAAGHPGPRGQDRPTAHAPSRSPRHALPDPDASLDPDALPDPKALPDPDRPEGDRPDPDRPGSDRLDPGQPERAGSRRSGAGSGAGGWRSGPVDELVRRRPLTGIAEADAAGDWDNAGDWDDAADWDAAREWDDPAGGVPPPTAPVPRSGSAGGGRRRAAHHSARPGPEPPDGEATTNAHQRVRRIVTQLRPGTDGPTPGPDDTAARTAGRPGAELAGVLMGRTARERGVRVVLLIALLAGALLLPSWGRGPAAGQPLSVQQPGSAADTGAAPKIAAPPSLSRSPSPAEVPAPRSPVPSGAAPATSDTSDTPPGLSTATSPTVPPSRSTAPSRAATPRHSAPAAAPEPRGGWLAELRRLDRARAQALVSLNTAALDAVYADTDTAAAARAADRTTIEQLKARGWRVTDATHLISSVGVVSNGADNSGSGAGGAPASRPADPGIQLVTLRVVDQLPAHDVVDGAGNAVGSTPARGPTTRIFQLTPAAGGYRIAGLG